MRLRPEGGLEIAEAVGNDNLTALEVTPTAAAPTYGAILNGYDSGSSRYGLEVRDDVGSKLLSVRNDGNIGIGTALPTSKLHVVGNIESTTYSVNGTAGANFSGAVTNITVVDGIVTAVS